MRIIVFLLISVFLTAYVFEAYAEGDIYYNTEQRSAIPDTDCSGKPNIMSKLDCIGSSVDDLGWAYMHLKPLSALEPDPDRANNILRLQGLGFDKAHNEKLLYRIDQHKIDEPEFIVMFEEAVIWAEEQKIKSGEELFTLSETIPKQIKQEALKDHFRTALLMLSAEKKYQPARDALDIILKR